VALEFAIFTHEPFAYQRIGVEVRRMRRLGMTPQAIGRALGIDEKTVRNTLRKSGPAVDPTTSR
jgi:transposase-like protein